MYLPFITIGVAERFSVCILQYKTKQKQIDMKFEVITTMSSEKRRFGTLGEVNEYITKEIRWWNSPSENRNNNGYTFDDFIINRLGNDETEG